MAAGDSSTISIVIAVEDGGSAAVIQNVERNISGMGTAGTTAGNAVASATQKMTTGFQQAHTVGATLPGALNEIASTAESAGSRVASSFGQIGGAVQGVRLGVQELGLHVPRAMESIIAHNETLAAGLRATMGIFIAMGAVGIFAQLAAGVADLYEKWFDVNKAVLDYQQKAGEAAQQKLFDAGSLETEISLLQQAQAEVDALNAKKVAAGADQRGGGFLQYLYGAESKRNLFGGEAIEGYAAAQGVSSTHQAPYTAANDVQAAQAQKDLATAQERTNQLQHQAAVERQRAEEEYDNTALTGRAKIAAGERDAITNAQMQLAYTKEQEQNLQKSPRRRWHFRKPSTSIRISKSRFTRPVRTQAMPHMTLL